MKKGISLVALVITIIVLIILSGTVILTVVQNGMIDKSEEAVFKTNIKSFLEDYTKMKMKKQEQTLGGFDTNSINASYAENNIREWIPSITDQFIERIFIQNGEFLADKGKYTPEELVWLEELGIGSKIAPIIAESSEWELDATKTKIVAYLGENNKDITIPNRIKDNMAGQVYVVKEVGENIFGDKKMSGTLTVSDNLTMLSDITSETIFYKLVVGDNVSFNTGIKLEAPGYISTVDEYKYINIGNNVTINGSAFDGNSYYESYHSSVYLTIGDNFYCSGNIVNNIHNIREVTIGDNATFNCQSFHNNYWLRKINIGKNLSLTNSNNVENPYFANAEKDTYGYNTFLEEVNIESFKNLDANVLKDCTLIKKVVLEDGGVISGVSVFYGCTGIEEVVLGNVDMSTIITSHNTFKGCTGIKKVTITKESGKKIKGSLFSGITSIETVVIEDNSFIPSTMFNGCTGLVNLTISNNVNFDNNCFMRCSQLEKVIIPANSILKSEADKEIMNIFAMNSNLKDITISEGITFIPQGMFLQCLSIKSVLPHESEKSEGVVVLPSTIKSIGQTAFNGCKELDTVIIPNSVTSIGVSAFINCSNLIITVEDKNVKKLVEDSNFTGTIEIKPEEF